MSPRVLPAFLENVVHGDSFDAALELRSPAWGGSRLLLASRIVKIETVDGAVLPLGGVAHVRKRVDTRV